MPCPAAGPWPTAVPPRRVARPVAQGKEGPLSTWFVGFMASLVVPIGLTLFVPAVFTFVLRPAVRLLFRGHAGRRLAAEACEAFEDRIRERSLDAGLQRSAATAVAVLSYLAAWKWWRRYRRSRSRYEELRRGLLRQATDQLVRGWRECWPPGILMDHVRVVTGTSCLPDDAELEFGGACAAASVTYLLGDLRKGSRMAQRVWSRARDTAAFGRVQLWMASYPFLNSMLFLGEFERSVRLMVDLRETEWVPLRSEERRRLLEQLDAVMTLNGVRSIPRHVILAGAFAGPSAMSTWVGDADTWPDREVRQPQRGRSAEEAWLQSWYEEGLRLCTADDPSLHFTHAYAAFHLTLLADDPATQSSERTRMLGRARQALGAIPDGAPLVSHYARLGFAGLYELAMGQEEAAMGNLRAAAQHSAVSGNSFLNCLFAGSHSVLASRAGGWMMSESEHYLRQADDFARRINRPFYDAIVDAARGHLARGRREEGRAARLLRRAERSAPHVVRLLERRREDESDA